MQEKTKMFLGMGLLVTLCFAILCQKCGEYNTNLLNSRNICIQAGHTALECGFVHQVPN